MFLGPPENREKVIHALQTLGFSDVTKSILADKLFEDFQEETLPGVALLGAGTKEGMTQKQLSELTGIPQGHISEMKNNKRAIGKKRAKVLGTALISATKSFCSRWGIFKFFGVRAMETIKSTIQLVFLPGFRIASMRTYSNMLPLTHLETRQKSVALLVDFKISMALNHICLCTIPRRFGLFLILDGCVRILSSSSCSALFKKVLDNRE